MLVSRIASGGDGIGHHRSGQRSIAQKTGDELLSDLENVKITSHTGLRERRELIQSWTAQMLVRAYNSLRTRLVTSQSIAQGDKILLEALEKEGITNGGKFTRKIGVTKIQEVPHGQGLTITNPEGKTLAGYTRIGVWKAINSTTP